jgi:hypothetical protein
MTTGTTTTGITTTITTTTRVRTMFNRVRPDRISCFARLATTTCAALLKESRMQIIKATDLNRKSGESWPGPCSLVLT